MHLPNDRTLRLREELGVVVIGLAAALVSVGFHHTIALADEIRQTVAENVHTAGLLPRCGAVLCCGLLAAGSVGVVRWFAREAEGSGIAAVIAAQEKIGPVRALRVTCVKFLGGFLALAAGMPLGREGPSVQIGAMTGAMIKKALPTWLYRAIAVRLGAVAGLSAAFNAPMTAVVFAFEMLHQPFTRQNCYETILVSAVADYVCRRLEGPKIELPLLHSGLPDLPMLMPVVLTSILTGLVAIVFQKSLLTMHSIFERLADSNLRALLATFGIGCLLGLALLVAPETLGVGHELFAGALTNQMTPVVAITALAIRIPLTAACYSTGAPGGLIVPAVLFGTLTGQAFSAATASHFAVNTADYHAVCLLAGMSAGLGAVFRMPLTSVLLTVEVTGTYRRLLEIAVAYLVAHSLLTRAGQPDLYTALAQAHMRTMKHDREAAKRQDEAAVTEPATSS